ncbi:MAG: acyloxyacyl hydrolase [Thermodesulfobacteriota bacterium]|nr:acyloxyacyl hydrolase [Thermodesulfobacteriota bacterium]
MKYGKFLKGTLITLVVFAVLVTSDNAGATSGGICCPVTESGIVIGYGTGNVEEGKYEPVLMIWHIGFSLKELPSGQHEDRKDMISFYIEPQINPVTRPETDVEFGVGAGLKYMHHITNSLSAYLMASVGPHWVTINTESQARGFVFSSTIGLGISVFVTDKSAVTLGYRVRHLSNANFRKPNGGIDTCFGTIGYSVFF